MSAPVKHPDFAIRMAQACDTNPNVPPHNFGRLNWFVDNLSRNGIDVSVETVRKWFSGEAMPRRKNLVTLAKVLDVREAFLAFGSTDDLPKKVAMLRNAQADGAVNLVAGMVQMSGGRPAFPRESDEHAIANKIDLYAIVRGAQYALHVVVVAPDGKISVPIEAKECLVIAVLDDGDLTYRLFDLDWDALEEVGKKKGLLLVTDIKAHKWRHIKSFSERL